MNLNNFQHSVYSWDLELTDSGITRKFETVRKRNLKFFFICTKPDGSFCIESIGGDTLKNLAVNCCYSSMVVNGKFYKQSPKYIVQTR